PSPVARPSVLQPSATGSPAYDVGTVGASVGPYVRLTTASKEPAACAANDAVTPAPPHEMSRKDATSDADGDKDMSCTKYVGGPIMNDTSSARMSESATDGSHRSSNTTVMPA